MKKIIIEKIFLKNGGGSCRLEAELSGEKTGRLFFEVEDKFGKYFDASRADCFVVALLPQAAMDGIDIESRVPVSARLLFQLNTFLCGVLAKVYAERKVKISAPLAEECAENAGAIGTGITCGVDSLYTVAEYSRTPFPKQNLTHLCLFNVGSHDIGADNPAEMERVRTDLARSFCSENGYEFLRINSNVRDFSPNYTRYYSILNMSAVMSVAKLFSCFYSSSGYSVSEFQLTATDLAHFEIFILDTLSSGTLKFYSAGAEVSRFEKVKRLTEFSPSYRFLNVCNLHAENCSVCIKCLRTLYGLDILDALDKYVAVFDIDGYRKNHSRFLAECWVRAHFAKDGYCREMLPLLRKKYGLSFPHMIRESIRFICSRLKIYSFSYICYRLRDAKH